MIWRRRRQSVGETPIDTQQRELAEQQEALRQEMAKLERLIEEAPLLAEQQERLRREELIRRASMHSGRIDAPAAVWDKRYEVHTISPPRKRSLKMQQREARIRFLVLVVVLLAVLFWVYSVMIL